MKYARLLTALYFMPWAIRPDVHRMLSRKLDEHMAKLSALPSRADLEVGDPDDDDDQGEAFCHNRYETGMGVMMIPVSGVIGKHLSLIEMLCGGYDLDWLSASLDDAMEDDSIHTIVINFDKPGGTTTGLREVSEKIRTLSESKTTIAYTENQCCSAGYYLAAACGEIVAAPSATVGCIGTFIAAIDSSRAWENEGLKLKLFRDGKLKAIGLEGKEWTPDEDAFLQGIVDKVSGQFKGFVRAQRPSVSDETMQGQWFDGEDGLALGLVDDNAPDLQSVITAAVAAGRLID